MDLYEINSKGLVFLEKISSLPVWTSAYEGRVIYDENTNKFYIGDNSKWVEGGGADWNSLSNQPTNLSDINITEGSKLAGIANNANNYTHPNHTGDVTSTGDGNMVIGNDKVSNPKLANMTGNTMKGRITSAGSPQDLTVNQVQSMIGSGGDGGHSFASSGYQKFTWGFMIQWGYSGGIANDGGAYVNFPIAFPHACLQVVTCHNRNVSGLDTWPDESMIVGSLSTTRCYMANTDGDRWSSARYIAYGY